VLLFQKVKSSSAYSGLYEMMVAAILNYTKSAIREWPSYGPCLSTYRIWHKYFYWRSRYAPETKSKK